MEEAASAALIPSDAPVPSVESVPSVATESQLITTDFQTSGRGQRGNHWESERGKNLLFSIAFAPNMEATRQFRLSQAAALSIIASLKPYCPNGLTIKWPNDIYYDDSKLAGMLLEHELRGSRILRTTLGIGLNVNQENFHSDAPNPISLRQIVGHELPRHEILKSFLEHWESYLSKARSAEGLQEEYKRVLYRREDFHAYSDNQGVFQAQFDDIQPDGRLRLRLENADIRTYAFKEVAYII